METIRKPELPAVRLDGATSEVTSDDVGVVRAGVPHTPHVVTEFVDDGRARDAGYRYGRTS